MSDVLTVSLGATAAAADTAKRRQIIEGARSVFLTQGFYAASMSDIARKAGVAKGKLNSPDTITWWRYLNRPLPTTASPPSSAKAAWAPCISPSM